MYTPHVVDMICRICALDLCCEVGWIYYVSSGVFCFCDWRHVRPSSQDLVVLIISWKMEADEMCVYSREEWRRGMSKLGVSTTRQLRQQARGERNGPASDSLSIYT